MPFLPSLTGLLRCATAVLMTVLAPVLALYGWGREGHRIVADIAQERLSEVTKRNVQRPERDDTYDWYVVDIPKGRSQVELGLHHLATIYSLTP